VELHFRAITGFGGSIDAHRLLKRAVEDSLEGHRVRYLRPEDELVYLATHATQHLYKGVAWLYDLKLFIRRYPALDWQSVISAARESGMQAPVYFALRTAQHALGADVPSSVLERLRPASWQVLLGRFVFSEGNLVDRSFAELRYAWMVAPFLASDMAKMTRAIAYLAWRAPLRKLARHFPNLAPAHWRA
ncbi:MAG TPA: nucleotidyltransferase family protein, partial [Myxococcaceae bacterium]|nr:nucleotidyltransferase family protein [Myxococcaceae bacterium]